MAAAQQPCWSGRSGDLGGDAKVICRRSTGTLDSKLDLISRIQYKILVEKYSSFGLALKKWTVDLNRYGRTSFSAFFIHTSSKGRMQVSARQL